VAQTQSHLMSHQYEGLMKKASLRGIGSKKWKFVHRSRRSAKTAKSCGAAASYTSFARRTRATSSGRA